jgi:hypothetical protein
MLQVMVWCIQLYLLQVAHQMHWLPSRPLWHLHSLQLRQVPWCLPHILQALLDQAPSLERTVCRLVGTHKLCLQHRSVVVSSRVLRLHQSHHICNRMASPTLVHCVLVRTDLYVFGAICLNLCTCLALLTKIIVWYECWKQHLFFIRYTALYWNKLMAMWMYLVLAKSVKFM